MAEILNPNSGRSFRANSERSARERADIPDLNALFPTDAAPGTSTALTIPERPAAPIEGEWIPGAAPDPRDEKVIHVLWSEIIVRTEEDGHIVHPRVEWQKVSPQDREELQASIKSEGILVPLIVRPGTIHSSGGRFIIVDGIRRYHVAEDLFKAGDLRFEKIPVIVRDVDRRAALAMTMAMMLRARVDDVARGAALLHLKEAMQEELNELTKLRLGKKPARSEYDALIEELGKDKFYPRWKLRALEAARDGNKLPVASDELVGGRIGLTRRGYQNLVQTLKFDPLLKRKIQEGALPTTVAAKIQSLRDPQARRNLAMKAEREKLSLPKVTEIVNEQQPPAQAQPANGGGNGITVSRNGLNPIAHSAATGEIRQALRELEALPLSRRLERVTGIIQAEAQAPGQVGVIRLDVERIRTVLQHTEAQLARIEATLNNSEVGVE